MFEKLLADIDSAHARDPASRGRADVIFFSAGFHSMCFYALSHRLWNAKWFFLARWIASFGRWLTGIEIHPAARIGRRFFIDHGAGVVIGETAEIGENVTLYHGVTLGGISPSENSGKQRGTKRHPTLQDGVIVGAGAQILGPILIGENATIGANAVVIQDVPPQTTVIGIPARSLAHSKKKIQKNAEFLAYGIPSGEQEDPIASTRKELLGELRELASQLSTLKAQLEKAPSKKVSAKPVKTPKLRKPPKPAKSPKSPKPRKKAE